MKIFHDHKKYYNSLEDDIIYMQINSFFPSFFFIIYASLFVLGQKLYSRKLLMFLYVFFAGSKWIYNDDHTDREAVIYFGQRSGILGTFNGK